jgi:hypothetical protein
MSLREDKTQLAQLVFMFIYAFQKRLSLQNLQHLFQFAAQLSNDLLALL